MSVCMSVGLSFCVLFLVLSRVSIRFWSSRSHTMTQCKFNEHSKAKTDTKPFPNSNCRNAIQFFGLAWLGSIFFSYSGRVCCAAKWHRDMNGRDFYSPSHIESNLTAKCHITRTLIITIWKSGIANVRYLVCVLLLFGFFLLYLLHRTSCRHMRDARHKFNDFAPRQSADTTWQCSRISTQTNVVGRRMCIVCVCASTRRSCQCYAINHTQIFMWHEKCAYDNLNACV